MSRTFGSLKLDRKKRAWVAAGVEPHVVIRMKQLFRKIATTAVGQFEFQDDPATCADLHWFFEQRYPLAMSEADRKALKANRARYETELAEAEKILLPDWRPPTYPGLRPGMQLRHYQAQAVELLRRRKRLLLGDAIGLGKTYTAAAAMLGTDAMPAAVVVEPHLTGQWKEKIEEFTDLRVHVIKGTRPYNLPEADVYVFRYSNVLGWADVFNTGIFKTAIYDEIQALRTGTSSAKGEACSVLSRNADVCLGLSATPIFGFGAEIWHVLQFIAGKDPHPLGRIDEFVREWCAGDGKTVKDPEALGSHLRETLVHFRRTRADVGKELEPINKLVYEIPYDHSEERRVEDLAKTLAIKTLSGSFVERGKAARDLDALLRHATGVGKAKSVAHFVRILLEDGEPVVLAGWHREFYDIVLKELAEFRPAMYTGSETPSGKARSVSDFLDGRTDLLVMSLRSGAGLDGLQRRCATMVIGELDWSPKVHDQIIGRLDREGQTRPVTAIFLHVDGGSDPAVMEVLGIKASQSKGIVDPGAGVETVHSDDGRVRALARAYLSRHHIKVTEAREDELLAAS